ncbi:MAG: hypothetical protein ACRD10_12480 [Terriglobia bacterium]
MWIHHRVVKPLALLFVFSPAVLAQRYTPAFPRDGAAKVRENAYFAIWDVTLGKGRPSVMHKIPLDEVTVFLSDGAVKFTRPNGVSTIEEERRGSVIYEPKGTVIAKESAGGALIHAVVFQIKDAVPPEQPAVKGIPGLLPRPGAVKLFEAGRISVWDDTWEPGVRTPVHLHYAQAAAVFLGGGTIGTFSADGLPGHTFSRKPGEVIISSHPRAPHAEQQLEGLPRAIWVEFN